MQACQTYLSISHLTQLLCQFHTYWKNRHLFFFFKEWLLLPNPLFCDIIKYDLWYYKRHNVADSVVINGMVGYDGLRSFLLWNYKFYCPMLLFLIFEHISWNNQDNQYKQKSIFQNSFQNNVLLVSQLLQKGTCISLINKTFQLTKKNLLWYKRTRGENRAGGRTPGSHTGLFRCQEALWTLVLSKAP